MVRAVTRLMSLVLGLVATAAVALAVAGCGNGEKNDYVDKVNEIQNHLQTQATQAISEAPANPAQAGELVKKLQSLFADTADQLKAVDPPSDVADLHQQLVDKVREVSEQIGKVSDAFDSGNPQQIQQAATDLQTAISSSQTDLSSLIDQINEQLQS
jgi:hypothetical protein